MPRSKCASIYLEGGGKREVIQRLARPKRPAKPHSATKYGKPRVHRNQDVVYQTSFRRVKPRGHGPERKRAVLRLWRRIRGSESVVSHIAKRLLIACADRHLRSKLPLSDLRDGREETLGVVALRMVEDVRGIAAIDEEALFHHANPAADVLDDREVVRNEED